MAFRFSKKRYFNVGSFNNVIGAHENNKILGLMLKLAPNQYLTFNMEYVFLPGEIRKYRMFCTAANEFHVIPLTASTTDKTWFFDADLNTVKIV